MFGLQRTGGPFLADCGAIRVESSIPSSIGGLDAERQQGTVVLQ
jgi:hypothetical protein